jgi:hypothetical protein
MQNNNPDLSQFRSPGIYTSESTEFYIDPKWHAIEFAKYVTNQQCLEDFWSMSIELQEEIYENFLKN